MPPFTALLSNSPLEVFGDHRPTLGAILVYQVNDLHKHHQKRHIKRTVFISTSENYNPNSAAYCGSVLCRVSSYERME